MRVLISGATGFIGRHLARHLAVDLGLEVRGLAHTIASPAIDGVQVHQADITDRQALARVIERTDPDAIIHLAGLSHVGESWQRPGDYLRVNFGGTRNLVHAAKGRCVIVASSAEVYGNVPESEQPIIEDRPLDPRSPYAMTKACAEAIALEHGALVVRSFNTVGPGQDLQFALPSFTSQLAAIKRGEREAVLHVGDLSPRRDFIHVDDAVRAYATVLEQGKRGEVYNVASGHAVTIADALDRLRAVSGVEARVEQDPARVRPVDVPLLQGDISKLRALGWAPERDLDGALHDLWRHIAGNQIAGNPATQDPATQDPATHHDGESP